MLQFHLNMASYIAVVSDWFGHRTSGKTIILRINILDQTVLIYINFLST